MLLDFDSAVSGIASQLLWLRWTGEDGQRVSHAPDYFVRRADGSTLVVDCRPVDHRPARYVAKFEATAADCARIEWEYQLVGAAEPVAATNVRWLAGYRHPRHDVPEIAGVLRQVFATPIGLHTGAGAAGDSIAVLPVLFHLLWQGELLVELEAQIAHLVRGDLPGRPPQHRSEDLAQHAETISSVELLQLVAGESGVVPMSDELPSRGGVERRCSGTHDCEPLESFAHLGCGAPRVRHRQHL